MADYHENQNDVIGYGGIFYNNDGQCGRSFAWSVQQK